VANELETRVLQSYLDQVEVPLPESMVHDELHYRANRFAQQLQMMGTNLEQYLQALGQTADDVEADLDDRDRFDIDTKVTVVLSGGDDYELLFTAPRAHRAELEALASELNIALTVIGATSAGAGITVLDGAGKPMAHRGGFDHFRDPR
jgi:FKBP-type peptidyl-prolyl cis-trans isomerase (trigger factor)